MIILMNKIVKCYYWFAIVCVIYLLYSKDVFAEETKPSSLNYKGKYTSGIKNYEIVVPQRVNKDGNFISHLVSHHHSKRSTKEMEIIFYKIPIAGKDYLIELTPNRKLISPGAVVEIHGEYAGKVTKKNSVNSTYGNDTLGEMFENLNIRKLKNTECHFSGRVKGENISKAALSTCYGLAGFIQIRKGFYTIEPVAEHDPFVEEIYPHILYKADGLENSSVCHTMGDLTASIADQVIRKRRESNVALSTPMYIETLIVMDKTLINHHQNLDCENYVLTVFNMAFNLFHDASLGLMMTLTIVRIIRLEVENDEMNLRVNADAEKTLRYFQTWQYEVNPGDDSHPNHHDIAVLITRVNVCYSPSSCGLLGLTTIGKACDPKLSAALCEDTGLRLGFVIAHEIGHLLGADHDSNNSTGNGTDPDGSKTVMHPQVSLNAQKWSKSSQAYFKTFIEKGLGSCFLDEPEEHHFNVQDLLPGVMYDADFQCKHLITINSRECDMGSTCDSLNCYVPGYACIVTHTPPADGTRCGENMWCHDAKCLIVGERPGAIDGNWGEWSPWSECSRTCGSGVASSVRQCDKPLPSQRGKNCVGERKRYKVCAATTPKNISDLIRFISEEVNVSFVGKPCETGRPSFRDIQCGEFDDWIYPEDGKTHTWKAYFYHDDNPCTLYCVSEENQVAALRPRVIDGTMCYRGIRDICVGGTCKNLPCDLHFESNAIEDACGVCHGDGTGCEFSEGMETFTKLTKGLTKLMNVPVGTRNIKVEEMSPTMARIIVRDKDTRDIYVRGKPLGMYNVPGSQAWLGMTKKNQEVLNIPGPITKPLSIWIQRLENVTIKWSVALPAEQQRKPEFAWDFLKWSPCSAKCGPGTQKSEPSCMEEKAGLVEDSFCAELEMPSAKVRPCEVAKCEPRWMVGDWKGCDQPGSQKKERKRVVYCIKTIGEGEGESQIVEDSECSKPKPHDRESCENRQKREDVASGENFFEDSMYKSDTDEFGFHKKYEDYLKHFAALSVPQRNSETIPLHLVSSPHFKHYFRVLETPDDYSTELGLDEDSDLNSSNNTMLNLPTQNKVSPDFYKNTFSGRQIDVSHVQSTAPLKDDLNFSEPGSSKRIKKNLSDFSQNERKKNFYEIGKRNSRKYHQLRYDKNVTSIPHNKFLKLPIKRNKYVFSRNKERKLRGKKKNLLKSRQSSSKISRSFKENLFAAKCCMKKFNYTSPNLTNLIDRVSEGNDVLKRKYLNLLRKDNCRKLPFLEKCKLINCHWNANNPKTFSRSLINLLKPFSRFPFLKKVDPDKISPTLLLDESKDSKVKSFRKITKEFDGSGFRRFPIKSEKLGAGISSGGNNKVKNDMQKWNFPTNPFYSTRPRIREFRTRKPYFRGRNIPLEDLFFDKKIGKIHSRDVNIKNEMRKRSISPLCKAGKFETIVWNCQICTNSKRKRSSHKWKKPKSKETNVKLNKDVSHGGCGTETRNYLNNLFRDSHPKQITKPESKQINEKPVIKIGKLVIDKDYAPDQHVEIIIQEDEMEAPVQRFKQLPLPPRKRKEMTLRGQQVFDLFQVLQSRSGRDAFYRPINNTGDMPEKIEIDVKIPEKTPRQTENASSTTPSTKLTTEPCVTLPLTSTPTPSSQDQNTSITCVVVTKNPNQNKSSTSARPTSTGTDTITTMPTIPSENETTTCPTTLTKTTATTTTTNITSTPTNHDTNTNGGTTTMNCLTTAATNTTTPLLGTTITTDTSSTTPKMSERPCNESQTEKSLEQSSTQCITQGMAKPKTTSAQSKFNEEFTTEESDCGDYDVDEVVLDSPSSTTEGKSKKKKKKCKKKKKNKTKPQSKGTKQTDENTEKNSVECECLWLGNPLNRIIRRNCKFEC